MFATILLTLLTTVGSIFASLLAAPLAPYVVKLFPKALDLTRNAIEGASKDTKKPKSSPWIRLSILRLVGIVPWSGINIACGVCGVSLWDCMLGNLVGTLPWTAVTCQVRIGWLLFPDSELITLPRSVISCRRLPRTREKRG